ncbi:hypothetical protein ACHAW6_004396 [Cyclotella cf. meneghiniana]
MSESTTPPRSNGKANLRRVDRSKLDDGGTGKSKVSYAQRRRRKHIFYAAIAAIGLAVAYVVVKSSKSSEGNKYLRDRLVRAQTLRDAISQRVGRKVDEQSKRKQFNNSNRYLDPRQLATLPGEEPESYDGKEGVRPDGVGDDEWRVGAKHNSRRHLGPKVDYVTHPYEYPKIMDEPPMDGSYPPMEPMKKIFETWGQDDLDDPPETIVEVLQHFDYMSKWQMEAALKFRDLELPFKVYNVPEVIAAGRKWTDEYLSEHFAKDDDFTPPKMRSTISKSVDNFFAFYYPDRWNTELLGPTPSVDIDWTFDKWARHAVYADETGLSSNSKHYYLEAGVSPKERHKTSDKWTFVSKDLPSFSSPEPTFFGFNPPEQKGIQCRFGERGVTAATHYDGGRNMVAMVTGAKRYILSPPNACPKLGVVTSRHHPSYRHSMLNFGRVTLLDESDDVVEMSEREREWLKIAGEAPTLSTVLKAGEVLYIPSHWFHYIISLQKSAQCNTRSGIDEEGNPNFGGLADVTKCTAHAYDDDDRAGD